MENVLLEGPTSIDCVGSGWALRNVGIRGDAGDTAIHCCVPDAGGTGVISNLYMADGSKSTGIWVDATAPDAHRGTITFDKINVGGFGDNGIYASGPGTKLGAASGGQVHIQNCFSHNNNISQFRIGTNGSTIKNSVALVDGPVNQGDASGTNGRGVWVREHAQNMLIENSTVAIRHPDGTSALIGYYGDESCMVRNCKIEGPISNRNVFTLQNVTRQAGSIQTPPVPQSAEAAASGNSSVGPASGSTGGYGGTGGSGPTFAYPTPVQEPAHPGPPAPEIPDEPASVENDPESGLQFDHGETDFYIADVALPGVYEVEEQGGGFTSKYVAEQTEQNRLKADTPEEEMRPPARTLSVRAYITDETAQELDDLRGVGEPMDVQIGDFTLDEMGITDISRQSEGAKQQDVNDVVIKLQEYRWVVLKSGGLGGTRAAADDQPGGDQTDGTPDDWVDESGSVDDVPDPDPGTTVNLGDDTDLADGDNIDPYLAEHLQSGTEVVVPSGTYTTEGFDRRLSNAILRGDGDVELQAQGTPGFGLRAAAGGGRDDPVSGDASSPDDGQGATVVWRGMDITGTTRGVTLEAAPDTAMLVDDVSFADGGPGTGVTAAGGNTGHVYARNLAVEGFSAGGAAGLNGRMSVQGGRYQNNGSANVVIDTSGMRVEYITSIQDSPSGSGPHRQLYARGAHENVLVRESDWQQSTDQADAAFVWADGTSGSSGTFSQNRITNDADIPAFSIPGSLGWSGTGNHMTGSGRTDTPVFSSWCVGSGCDSADTTPSAVSGSSG